MSKLRSFKATGILFAAAVIMIPFASPAGAATRIHIENPTFNSPHVASGYSGAYGVGDNRITGWQIVDGNVDVYASDWAQAGDSTQSLAVNGTVPGTIQQTIDTTPNVPVRVTLRAGYDTWSGCTTNVNQRIFFQVDGNPDTYRGRSLGRAPSVPSKPNYRTFTYTFTPDRANTQLQIGSATTNGGACGPQITDVRATQG